MSWRSKFSRRWKLAGTVLILAAALSVPVFIKDPRTFHILITSGVLSILAMGWVLLLRVGQFSLGQAAFLAIGSYTSSLLAIKLGISPWLGILAGGVLSAIVALGVGVIVLRLRGLYFAVVTLAFAEIVRLLITNWDELTRGYFGLTSVPTFPDLAIPGLFAIGFGYSRVPYYYLTLILVGIAGVVFLRLDAGWTGKVFRAVSGNWALSQSLGINLMKYRVLAFVIGALFAGIAGGFYAHYYMFVHPDSFHIWASVRVQIQASVGGAFSAVAGPIIGATLMTFVSELTSGFKGIEFIIYGVLIIIVVFFLPDGLVGLGRFVPKWASYIMGKAHPRSETVTSEIS